MDDSVKYAQQENTNKLDKFDENGNKIIDICPLTKGKRMLVFICDFIIAFFLMFLLFNVAAFPIAKAASGYDQKMNEKDTCEVSRIDILNEKNLLFKDPDFDLHYFEKSLDYTFNRFLLYWVSGSGSLQQFDIFKNYYIDIRNDNNAYNNSYFLAEDKDNYYFNYDQSNKPISLKDEYKTQFGPIFDSSDDMSVDGEKMLEDFKNKFFTDAYSKVIYDIKKNDLISSSGLSFVNLEKTLDEITNYENIVYISTTIASYILSWIILYIIIPLCNKHGKTVSMMMLGVERIGTNNLYLLRKGEVLISSIYSLASNLAGVMFIPMSVVPFNYIFALTPLLVISLFSLGFILISMFFILFNSFNKSLSDFLTQSICISRESLDEIYREKGYKI